MKITDLKPDLFSVEHRDKLMIASYAQTNFTAMFAHIIRLGAKMWGHKTAISHTGLLFFYHNRLWALDKTKKGLIPTLFEKTRADFKGKIYIHILPKSPDSNLIKIILENTIPDYNWIEAVQSQTRKNNKPGGGDYCTYSINNIVEEHLGNDFFPGDNSNWTPSEEFDFLHNLHKNKSIPEYQFIF